MTSLALQIGDHDAGSRSEERTGCGFSQTGATAGYEKVFSSMRTFYLPG
jgi:hypothetical protein